MDNILYIDDEQENLLSFPFLFLDKYNTLTAQSTKQAEEILKKEDVKVVVCDQRMPDENGLDFIQRIKPEHPDIIYIILTAYVETDLVIESINTGIIYRFLTKPFDVQDINIAVDNAVDKYNLRLTNKRLINELQQKNHEYEIMFEKLLKTKKEVKANEEKYKTLFISAGDAAFVFQDNKIIDCNQRAINILKGSKEEIMGLAPWDISPPCQPDGESSNEKAMRMIGSGYEKSIFEFEWRHKNLKGELLDIEVTLSIIDEEKMIYLSTWRDITERKKAELSVLEMEKKIFSTMVSSEENERERYAKELHDGLDPLLSTSMIYLHSMLEENNIETMKEYITRTYDLVHEATQSIREISNNLSPDILKKYGLIQAVRSFIEKLKLISQIKFIVHSKIDCRFDEVVEFTLYRTITELINNSVKYARAKKIEINLDFIDVNLVCKYCDDGQGFEYEKVKSKNEGFGLFNLESRIRKLGGQYDYFSAPGKGTNVKITIQTHCL